MNQIHAWKTENALSGTLRCSGRRRRLAGRGGRCLQEGHRWLHSRRADLMQHLNEAYQRAEDFLSEWLTSKPSRWRILVVKDVLSMLRVILWCADNERESSATEIDAKLREVCTDYWSKSVLPGQLGDHPDKAWQEDAWRQGRPHENTDRLRILEKHLTKSGWFEAPIRSAMVDAQQGRSRHCVVLLVQGWSWPIYRTRRHRAAARHRWRSSGRPRRRSGCSGSRLSALRV